MLLVEYQKLFIVLLYLLLAASAFSVWKWNDEQASKISIASSGLINFACILYVFYLVQVRWTMVTASLIITSAGPLAVVSALVLTVVGVLTGAKTRFGPLAVVYLVLANLFQCFVIIGFYQLMTQT